MFNRKEADPTEKIGKARRFDTLYFQITGVSTVCGIILGLFFPGVGLFVQGSWYAAWLGISLMGFGGFVVGAYCAWLLGSPEDITDDKKITTGYLEAFPLTTLTTSAVDSDPRSQGVSQEEQSLMRKERASGMRGPSVGASRILPVRAFSTGGGFHWGFRSLSAFSRGAIIQTGKPHFFLLGRTRVWTHRLVPRHYSYFTTETIAGLKGLEGQGFNLHKTVLFDTEAAPIPEWVRHLETDPESQAIVLKKLGFDGLGTRFWAEWDAEARARGVPVTMESRREVTALFDRWLKQQEPLAVTLSHDWAMAQDWHAFARRMTRELGWERAEKEHQRRGRLKSEEGQIARSDRRAAIAGRREPFDPAAEVVRTQHGPIPIER